MRTNDEFEYLRSSLHKVLERIDTDWPDSVGQGVKNDLLSLASVIDALVKLSQEVQSLRHDCLQFQEFGYSLEDSGLHRKSL